MDEAGEQYDESDAVDRVETSGDEDEATRGRQSSGENEREACDQAATSAKAQTIERFVACARALLTVDSARLRSHQE